MSNSFIGLPADGPGKKLDSEQLTVGSNTVQRERLQISGDADVEIVRVRNTDPAADDHALVIREVGPVFPVSVALSSAALSAGASVDLNAVAVPLGRIGKLLQVTLSSSVSCKWVIKKREGIVVTTLDVVFTGGLSANPTCRWRPPHKDFTNLPGNGTDTHYRISATNLDDASAADVYATPYWDEVI